MSCKFCYATYNTFKVSRHLEYQDVCLILKKLHEAGVKKVTFAGGEPMLYKDLQRVIKYAKHIGLTTSIITNGSLLTVEWLQEMVDHLDWIGLSIDSVMVNTNKLIGRTSKINPNYYSLTRQIHFLGYKLKINTVVNRYNQHENMSSFIKWAAPDRWKIFDTLRVQGQNEQEFDNIKSTKFDDYIARHHHKSMVVENNENMTASYLLIDPLGRFYENWGAETKKSDSLVDHSVEHCLSQITVNREAFINRGGIYEW